MVNVIGGSRYRVNKKSIVSYVDTLLAQKNVPEDATVNIVFIGKRKMRAIAREYKKEDEALPVLAFPYKQTEDKLLGEIFLCFPQLILMAAHRNRTVDEIIKEMVAHGLKNVIS